MNEIDLIKDSGILYPLEIKKHADLSVMDPDAFSEIDRIHGAQRGSGGVICTYETLVALRGNDRSIPVNYL